MSHYRRKIIKSKIRKSRPRTSLLKNTYFWSIIFFLFFFLALFYFLFFYPLFQIKDIYLSSLNRLEERKILDFTHSYIRKTLIDWYWLRVETKSIFLTSSHQLQKAISQEFPLVKEVAVKRRFPRSLEIRIVEREPFAIYCSNNQPSECFFIDDKGVIFEQSLVGSPYFIMRLNNAPKDLKLGEKVIEQEVISAVFEIQQNLEKNFKIKLKEVIIDRPWKLIVWTEEGWKIFFDLKSLSQLKIQLLKLNTLLVQEISSEERKFLEYIDLRFKDRAQVKPAGILQ